MVFPRDTRHVGWMCSFHATLFDETRPSTRSPTRAFPLPGGVVTPVAMVFFAPSFEGHLVSDILVMMKASRPGMAAGNPGVGGSAVPMLRHPFLPRRCAVFGLAMMRESMLWC